MNSRNESFNAWHAKFWQVKREQAAREPASDIFTLERRRITGTLSLRLPRA